MSFPETHLTLIQRIAEGGSEADWRQFLTDYWNPACEFAVRWGRVGRDDAEDIVSSMFVILIRNQLLKRWSHDRSAKLRTLLCGVIRKVLANSHRANVNRAQLIENELRVLVERGIVHSETSAELPAEEDIFYRAWVRELLRDAVVSLENELGLAGRDDDFRVLYGRICENMTFQEIADCLLTSVSSSENGFKYARKALERLLRTRLREHVRRYSSVADAESEFECEWRTLGAFLELKSHSWADLSDRRAGWNHGARFQPGLPTARHDGRRNAGGRDRSRTGGEGSIVRLGHNFWQGVACP